MIAIDKEYERVNDETTKSYKLKREKLNKEEDLKDNLKNEVTKIKENLENILSKVNDLSKSCEKIKKGMKSFEKEEKYILRALSYISNISKNQIEMYSLINLKIENLKITFNEDKNIIEFDKYYFNGEEKRPKEDEQEEVKIEEVKIKEEEKPIEEEVKSIEEEKPIEEERVKPKEEEKPKEGRKKKHKKGKKPAYDFIDNKNEEIIINEKPKEEKLNNFDDIQEEKEKKPNYDNEIKEVEKVPE